MPEQVTRSKSVNLGNDVADSTPEMEAHEKTAFIVRVRMFLQLSDQWYDSLQRNLRQVECPCAR